MATDMGHISGHLHEEGQLTAGYEAVAEAGDARGEEALPARLLVPAVVQAAAAWRGRPREALVGAGGGAGAAQLPLVDLHVTPSTHPWPEK